MEARFLVILHSSFKEKLITLDICIINLDKLFENVLDGRNYKFVEKMAVYFEQICK